MVKLDVVVMDVSHVAAGGVVVAVADGSAESVPGRLRGVMDVAEEEWLLVV